MVLAERLDLPTTLADAVASKMRTLRAVFSGRGATSTAEIGARRDTMHRLAAALIEYATSLESKAESRLAVRAGVCAELVASGLADYGRAFDDKLANDQPGETLAEHMAG